MTGICHSFSLGDNNEEKEILSSFHLSKGVVLATTTSIMEVNE
jgi:hypothetical protein